MKLEELVGQKLMIGVPGSLTSQETIQLFRETHAGGLILYRRNFRGNEDLRHSISERGDRLKSQPVPSLLLNSAEGLRRSISDLEEGLGRKLLIAVDHEGGRVIHLAEGITVFPDSLALGMTDSHAYAKRQGEIEGRELRRLGIDLNLAPCLDVLTENFSPNIGIRSYGSDPERVSRLGAARIQGMQSEGLSACAKHFPGQGHSPVDAHLGLPVLGTSREKMRAVHLKPFKEAIEAGVDTIMSSHPVYRELEQGVLQPATFSRRLIHDCLRKELRFEGVILSDDLEMGALKGICSIGEAACRAVEAGHDLVLVSRLADLVEPPSAPCRSHGTGQPSRQPRLDQPAAFSDRPERVAWANSQREVYQSLLRGYKEGRLGVAELEESVERIRNLKKKRLKRFREGAPVAEPEGELLARKIAKEAVQISGTVSKFRSTCERGADSICVIFPKLSALEDQVFIETPLRNEKVFVREVLTGLGVEPKTVQIVGLDPSDREIENAGELAQRYEFTILFCYDAHLFPSNRKLLEIIQATAKVCGVVLLRDPYDEEWVKEGVLCVKVFGFRTVQIRAALESLFSFAGDSTQARPF